MIQKWKAGRAFTSKVDANTPTIPQNDPNNPALEKTAGEKLRA
ncbi:hypothetical protein BofuT4_P157230.1 [Botrytis cinerea T4]|uniref:Uncharacterized protein n=1 Tax=Botryotinia fuckeliana (strain T4) TaxID=999810 RepID=G2YUM9_BOTF4|nr:hypothetical protein BofuT4_P157230.1 [Botrytis cinerea T4]